MYNIHLGFRERGQATTVQFGKLTDRAVPERSTERLRPELVEGSRRSLAVGQANVVSGPLLLTTDH